MKPRKEFKVPLPFLSVQEDAAKFMHQKAEIFLTEILRAEELLTDRSYKILGVLIPIFLVVCGFAVNLISTDASKSIELFILSLISSIALLVSILIIYFNLFPKDVLISGRQPAAMMEFEVILKNKDQFRAFLIDDLRITQNKITANIQQYNIRLGRFRFALHFIVGMLIADSAIIIIAILCNMG